MIDLTNRSAYAFMFGAWCLVRREQDFDAGIAQDRLELRRENRVSIYNEEALLIQEIHLAVREPSIPRS